MSIKMVSKSVDMNEKKCGHCQTLMDKARPNAKFCGDACKQAEYRSRQAGETVTQSGTEPFSVTLFEKKLWFGLRYAFDGTACRIVADVDDRSFECECNPEHLAAALKIIAVHSVETKPMATERVRQIHLGIIKNCIANHIARLEFAAQKKLSVTQCAVTEIKK